MGGQKGVRRLPANPGLVQRIESLRYADFQLAPQRWQACRGPGLGSSALETACKYWTAMTPSSRKRRGIAKHSVLYKAERDQLMLVADSRPKECHVPSQNCGSRRGSGDHLCQPPVWHHDSLWSTKMFNAIVAAGEAQSIRVVIITGGLPDIFIRHYDVESSLMPQTRFRAEHRAQPQRRVLDRPVSMLSRI